MSDQLQEIPINDISPNPFQPRLQFNQAELDELASSIKANGLLQPIIVRKSSVFGYELVAGERRLRASQLAHLSTIPAIIKELSDEDSQILSIIENLQRSDLNPIEEAKAYQNLIDTKQMTHEEISQVMGKSRPYISNTLRLLQLAEPTKQALEEGQLTQGHARLLLRLSHEEQERWLEKIQNQDLSVRSLEAQLKPKAKSKKSSPKADPFKAEMEQALSRQLGTPVTITLTKQEKGHITIDFSSTEDFNRIINNLQMGVDNKNL